MTKCIDIAGERYGRLHVVRRDGSTPKGQAMWLCTCDCGNEKRVVGTSLRAGLTTSCGCYQREATSWANRTHGQSGYSRTREYTCWANMLRRCDNPEQTHYERYGGRGIRVCTAWYDFERFYRDMGACPPGYEIDRIFLDGDYTPENCRWVDGSVQSYNRHVGQHNTSGVTGVTWSKATNNWHARIGYRGSRVHLGTFDSFSEAVAARKGAELRHYGFNPDKFVVGVQ